MADAATAEGTGRRAGLARDDVVAAAQGIVERDGAAALTMRRLAADLGVTTTTIYWHVGGRDEVVLAVIERVSAELASVAIEGDTPRRRVRSVVDAVWASAFAHRNVTALAHQVGATSLLELPLEVALATELEAAGLHGPELRDAMRSILMCVAGFLVVGMRRSASVPTDHESTALWAHVDADVAPDTRAALCEPADVGALFEATLAVVVDALVPDGSEKP